MQRDARALKAAAADAAACRPTSPIQARVVDVLAAHLAVDDEACTPDARLCSDLGLDSLDVVELEMDLEATLGIPAETMDDAIAALLDRDGTVGELVRIVERCRS